MKKRWLITICLCALVLPTRIYAEELLETPQQQEEQQEQKDVKDEEKELEEDEEQEEQDVKEEEEDNQEEEDSNVQYSIVDSPDPAPVTGQVEIDGKLYYYDENGNQQTGWIYENGKVYFYSRTYGYALKGWVTNWEGTWYQQEDGSLLTGIHYIGGKNYYFGEDGKLKTGWVTIDDKIYFFSRTYGYALKGWVTNWEGTWYQKEDGSLLTGKQTLDGKKYYFGEDGKLKTGWITEDGKIYFYSRTYGYALKGWVTNWEGTWYQQEDGSLLTGKQTLNGKNYYFGEDGKLKTGWITEEGKIYFYSRTYGYALKGWVTNWEGTWYQQPDGSLLTGRQTLDGKNYYFGEDGKLKTGWITEEDKLYFFSRTYGYALRGVVRSFKEGTWYQLADGEVAQGNGVQVLDDKEYYLEGRNLKSGLIEIEGKKYYFSKRTFEKLYKTTKTKYKQYVLDSTTGEFIKRQYTPVYYMQKDSRWSDIKYGISTMGKTGCSPTSMAMAFSSILEREVLPTEVADFLYYNTDQFNRRLSGTSGMGIIHASNYFNVKWTNINTKEDLINALKAGKIVYASMQNGKFAKPTYNHAIIMYNYNESKNETYTLDPLTVLNNGWNDIDLIWREQCMDPDDRTGGSAFYSLEEK